MLYIAYIAIASSRSILYLYFLYTMIYRLAFLSQDHMAPLWTPRIFQEGHRTKPIG